MYQPSYLPVRPTGYLLDEKPKPSNVDPYRKPYEVAESQLAHSNTRMLPNAPRVDVGKDTLVQMQHIQSLLNRLKTNNPAIRSHPELFKSFAESLHACATDLHERTALLEHKKRVTRYQQPASANHQYPAPNGFGRTPERAHAVQSYAASHDSDSIDQVCMRMCVCGWRCELSYYIHAVLELIHADRAARCEAARASHKRLLLSARSLQYLWQRAT
jgi:hypothetical protein